MPLRDADEKAVDEALRAWRQGDVSLDAGLEFLHLADLTRPHSPASLQVSDAMADRGEELEAGPVPVLDEVRGVVMLSQTCDVVRGCLPNPPVGCVLVREAEVIATGYTHPPGGCHAKASALSKVGGTLEDVEAYVTLEPCSFQGRTPSCAMELVERRIGTVFVAVIDPHPRNRGRGIELLRQAGIDVVVGTAGSEVTRFIGPYLIQR